MSIQRSISLSEQDDLFLATYVRNHPGHSRSSAIAKAIESMRHQMVADEHLAATREWTDSEDAELWDRTTGDGISADKLQHA